VEGAHVHLQGEYSLLLSALEEDCHAHVPPGASIDDPLGLLEGDGEVSRVARFADAADLEAKKQALAAVIRAWMVAKSRSEGVRIAA